METKDVIGGTHAASSSHRLVTQEEAALVAGAKIGDAAALSYWSNGTRGRFCHWLSA